MRLMYRKEEKGFVLIFALGILAVLSIIGTSFVLLSGIERTVANNYLDDVRAKILAQTGLETAVARLRNDMKSRQGDKFGADQWIYRHNLRYFYEPGHGLELTTNYPRPSYRVRGNDNRFVSGFVGGNGANQGDGTYKERGDTYKLKILDTASQINVNNPPWVLNTMLTSLGRALQEQAILTNPFPTPAQVTRILQMGRVGQSPAFRTKEEFKDAMVRSGVYGSGQVAQNRVDNLWPKLADFLAVQGWMDINQFKPKPSNTYRKEVNLSPSARYPINLNTAPRAVLQALFFNIQGIELTRIPVGGQLRFAAFPSGSVAQDAAWAKRATPVVNWDQARQLANDILIFRRSRPYERWFDFEDYMLRRLPLRVPSLRSAWYTTGPIKPGQTSVYKAQPIVYAILANCSPNPVINKFMPEVNRHWPVDKIDLTRSTTEICFHSMGYFEVESLGQVEGPDPREIVAQKRLRSEVKIYDTYVHTTQKQFSEHMYWTDGTVTFPETVEAIRNVPYVGPNKWDGYIMPSEHRYLQYYNIGPPRYVGYRYRNRFGGGNIMEDFFTTQYFPYINSFTGYVPKTGPYNQMRGDTTGGARPTYKKFGIYKGDDLKPNGVIRRGGIHEELNYRYPVGSAASAEFGAWSCWIKFADVSHGTYETIAYLNMTPHSGAAAGVASNGIVWKLEKFGNNIVSTRFYYKGDDPARTAAPPFNQSNPTRYPSVLRPWTEKAGKMTGWNDYEWHELYHAWWNTTFQALYLDDKAALWGWLGVPNATNTRDRYYLASNQIISEMTLGGYQFQGRSRQIYRAGAQGNGVQYRYMDGQIDDVKVQANPYYVKYDYRTPGQVNFSYTDLRSGVRTLARNSRYAMYPASPPWYYGYFRMPSTMPRNSQIGSMSVNVRYPERYENRPIIRWNGWTPSWDMYIRWFSLIPGQGWRRAAQSNGQPDYMGRAQALTGYVQPNQSVRYLFRFMSQFTGANNVAPIIDDVTLTVFSKPVYLSLIWL